MTFQFSPLLRVLTALFHEPLFLVWLLIRSSNSKKTFKKCAWLFKLSAGTDFLAEDKFNSYVIPEKNVHVKRNVTFLH